MKISYFSFGSSHALPNKHLPVKAHDPREVMFKFFSDKWCWEYPEHPPENASLLPPVIQCTNCEESTWTLRGEKVCWNCGVILDD